MRLRIEQWSKGNMFFTYHFWFDGVYFAIIEIIVFMVIDFWLFRLSDARKMS